ncbi:prepilin-type N-terminal cleavage/methylation domain-containing protein [Caulobacter sp. SLTY]|uniref:GspH/FimT family pseudopilin n=1 Tax=Caulobacter sp. SLTY TaxID=2683262 RepID=UPI001412EDFF|nr:GspH/FimT family pseudopilin [Caulobacter sp. SLTY]NBB14791.1 prepilin-type N-terminal cleavage/methylation domain-containing protein [Caulobacter sp. SLTY]
MTRTSAIGNSQARQGFTLVELMVVLAVLGLMAAVVVIAIPDGRMTLAAEGERFAARLKRAQEEAVLTNRPVEAALTPAGYAFRVRRAGGWQALDEGPFREEAWLAGTEVSAEKEATRVAFDPTGLATPAQFTLRRRGQVVEVAVDAAGNVTVDAH